MNAIQDQMEPAMESSHYLWSASPLGLDLGTQNADAMITGHADDAVADKSALKPDAFLMLSA
jgi:hypothetical protein